MSTGSCLCTLSPRLFLCHIPRLPQFLVLTPERVNVESLAPSHFTSFSRSYSHPIRRPVHHPPSGPSAFLSIGRIAAFVGGSIYAGQKMGALQAEANAADLKLLAEFDLAEARKPAAERHVLGTHMGPATYVGLKRQHDHDRL
jgi:hypothetical protein